MKSLFRILSIVALACCAPHLPAAETAAKTEAKAKAGAKVDINTADTAALESLPGVGPATARAIIAARPFSSVDDLERVPGIGAAKLAEIKPLAKASRVKTVAADAKPATKASTATKTDSSTNRPAARPASTASTAKSAAGSKIDVNTADATALEQLPGVGPVTARAIVAGRPYASVDDLERVPGIGPGKLAELRDQVTVSARSADRRATTVKPSAAPATARTREDRPLEPTGRTAATPTGRINLNTATRAELEALPEIGPVKAQAIIDARPFSSVEDVMRVKGIKEGTFEVIKDRISVR